MNYLIIIAIGFFQCLSMIPGTSRAAATIICAMFLGCSRALAVEFSFFLAIPTMLAASAYSLITQKSEINNLEWLALAIGFLVSFLVAYAIIAFLMNYIQKHNFKVFAYYRIVLASIVLMLFYLNYF